MQQAVLSEEEVNAMVPDEFSDDGSQDEMEEFEENEEQFEVRPSVSSRGSIARMGRDRNTAVNTQPQNKGTYFIFL